MPQDPDKDSGTIVWTTFDSPANSVSQGDLFYFEEEDSSRSYGIVVTADCDLANNKHSRLVSFVPLLALEDVLISCIYIDYIERKGDDIARMLHKELKSDVPVNDPAFSATICAILKQDQEIPTELREAAKIYLHQSDRISTNDFTALLKRLNISVNKAFEKFDQQINSRGDIIVLTRPPYVTHDVRIAWLRRVWQTNLGDLALRNSSYVSNKNRGQHVAQLASPFKYRLTQQFAQVFSDIGTPDICRKWIGETLKEKYHGK